MKIKIVTIMAAVLFFAACNEGEVVIPSPDTERIMVKQKNASLFADLDDYDWNSLKTRSDINESNEAMVSLEELLDRPARKSRTFRGLTIDQIPFIDDGQGYNVRLSPVNLYESDEFSSDMTITGARKFYLKSSDESVWSSRVVTMIPDSAFLAKFSLESVSYLDKALFSGIILFSNPDGSFRDVYVYDGESPVSDAQMDRPGTAEENTGNTRSLLLSCDDASGTATRLAESGRTYRLHYSICVAYVKKDDPYDSESLDNTLEDRLNQDSDEEKMSSGGGGGGRSQPLNSEMNEDFFTCTLALYSTTGGRAVGSGRYPFGRDVTVKASPFMIGYEFDRWTGDLNGRASTYSFSITTDVEATAYFKSAVDSSSTSRPCWSAFSGKANPLNEMTLAASGTGGWNLTGATYGNTRVGVIINDDGSRSISAKWHGGLDLMAEVGTPVFAMFDGKIGSTYVISQPDRGDDGRYPSSYSGDMNDAGNRIYVESEIDGNRVVMGYCHLQSGTPVAINPRTGKSFAPGDKVFRGEIVAYTGQTGNAFNVENKHLHLTAQENGRAVNPEKYINGKVEEQEYLPGDAKVKSEKLIEIRCDEEPQDEEPSLKTGYLFK